MRRSSVFSLASGLAALILLAPSAMAAEDSSEWRAISYTCESGNPLTVAYRETGSSVKVTLAADKKPVRLNARPARTGFRYADSLYELRGEGEVVTIRIGSKDALKCVSSDPSAPAVTAAITR